MPKISKELILAIETSFSGGSLSVLNDCKEIDFWRGSGEISKAEDILQAVDQILKKNNIKKEDLNRLAVSTGPGSFTSIRIGMATALGLSKYLNCVLAGVSILEAISYIVCSDAETDEAINIFVNKPNKIFWKYASDNIKPRNYFNEIAKDTMIPYQTDTKKIQNQTDTKKIRTDSFIHFLQNKPEGAAVLNILTEIENSESLKKIVREFQESNVGEIHINWLSVANLAKYIGKAGSSNESQPSFAPIYL